MTMASETLHEDAEKLGTETIDRHRAIVSLMEELEAVDWYDQRVKATDDEELRAILAHNRDEEKEHAAMVLEWLRRRDRALSDQLKAYLFKDGPIHERGEANAGASSPGRNPDGSLGIGSLRKDPGQAAGRPRAIS
jgi:ferritin-like protein